MPVTPAHREAIFRTAETLADHANSLRPRWRRRCTPIDFLAAAILVVAQLHVEGHIP